MLAEVEIWEANQDEQAEEREDKFAANVFSGLSHGDQALSIDCRGFRAEAIA